MTTLRRVLILPFLVGVFSLLSLSVGKSQVKYVTKTTNGNLTVTKTVEKDSENLTTSTITTDSTYESGDNDTITTNNFTVKLKQSYSKEELDKTMNDLSIGLGPAIVELNKLAKNPDIANRKEGINKVFKSMDIKLSSSNVENISFSDEFVASFTKEDFKASADNFSRIKTNIDNLKKEKYSNTKLMAFSQQMMLLMQDNLISKVLKDVLSQTMGTLMGSMQSMTGAKGDKLDEKNGMSGLMGNMTGLMNNMTGMMSTMIGASNGPNASPQVDEAVVESPQIDDAVVVESPQIDDAVVVESPQIDYLVVEVESPNSAYQSKAGQVKEIGVPFEHKTSIYSISKNKTETIVTLVLPIEEANSWFQISSAAKIVDANTKDEYFLRKAETDIPLDKMIIAPQYKDRMIGITLTFPLLKNSVKIFSLIVGTISEKDKPEGAPWHFIHQNLGYYFRNGSSSPEIYK